MESNRRRIRLEGRTGDDHDQKIFFRFEQTVHYNGPGLTLGLGASS